MKKQYYATSTRFLSPDPSTIPIPNFDDVPKIVKEIKYDKDKSKLLLKILKNK